MSYTTTITIDNVIDALATFLDPFMPIAGRIVRAQSNRVSMPPDPCAVLTELFTYDTQKPHAENDPINQLAVVNGPKRAEIQIDFYGAQAGDLCNMVKGVIRSEIATNGFPDGIKPLYADDGIQAPLIDGQHQWHSRWSLKVSLQYNPLVSLPQQSAIATTVNTVAADVLYQP